LADDTEWGGVYYSNLIGASVSFFDVPLSHPAIATSLYTSGVTGSGTSTLVFDTANAAPGIYYLGSDGVVMAAPRLVTAPATFGPFHPSRYRFWSGTDSESFVLSPRSMTVSVCAIAKTVICGSAEARDCYKYGKRLGRRDLLLNRDHRQPEMLAV
jgi:hypothetical protein